MRHSFEELKRNIFKTGQRSMLMKTWQEFENSCYEHLLKEYGDFCSFEQLGKSDSTNSDIKVTKRNKEKFFIETKDNRAQCGQFVLLPDEEKSEFVYSTRNKSNLNKYSQKIIDYMNKHFEVFAQAGTSGKDITISKDVLSVNCIPEKFLSILSIALSIKVSSLS